MQSIAEENLLEVEHKIKIETNKNQEKELEESSDDEEAECSCSEVSYADAVFSSCIVAPLVVGVWRGTWNIMEMYPELFPIVQQFLLAILIHVSFALVRSYLLSRSAGAWSQSHNPLLWLRERVISKIYTYVFIITCIMHWRGGFGLLDMLVAAIVPGDKDPHRPVAYAGVTILLYVIISCLRSSRNLMAAPYFLFTDGKEATYVFTTRFQAKMLSKLNTDNTEDNKPDEQSKSVFTAKETKRPLSAAAGRRDGGTAAGDV